MTRLSTVSRPVPAASLRLNPNAIGASLDLYNHYIPPSIRNTQGIPAMRSQIVASLSLPLSRSYRSARAHPNLKCFGQTQITFPFPPSLVKKNNTLCRKLDISSQITFDFFIDVVAKIIVIFNTVYLGVFVNSY